MKCVSVVSYWISTSNHNEESHEINFRVVVSYWISTSNHNSSSLKRFWCAVVSYWISTSNHNLLCSWRETQKLYLIEFLHQTTTRIPCIEFRRQLYLIEFLHQTTTAPSLLCTERCCILLNFYIKPQHARRASGTASVVSYWISTSNHNYSVRIA